MADLSDFLSQQAMRPLYKEVIAACTPSILVRVSDGTILDSSSVVAQQFGYLDDELIGKTIFDLMPERFREPHKKHLGHYTQDPHVRSMGDAKMELFGVTKKGVEMPIEIILVPTWRLGYLAVVATILRAR